MEHGCAVSHEVLLGGSSGRHGQRAVILVKQALPEGLAIGIIAIVFGVECKTHALTMAAITHGAVDLVTQRLALGQVLGARVGSI